MKVKSTCRICYKTDEFEMPIAGFEKRRRGAPMQEAFPDATPERIRQLTESICPKCQENEHVAATDGF